MIIVWRSVWKQQVWQFGVEHSDVYLHSRANFPGRPSRSRVQCSETWKDIDLDLWLRDHDKCPWQYTWQHSVGLQSCVWKIHRSPGTMTFGQTRPNWRCWAMIPSLFTRNQVEDMVGMFGLFCSNRTWHHAVIQVQMKSGCAWLVNWRTSLCYCQSFVPDLLVL